MRWLQHTHIDEESVHIYPIDHNNISVHVVRLIIIWEVKKTDLTSSLPPSEKKVLSTLNEKY